jgi:hypothetical protein
MKSLRYTTLVLTAFHLVALAFAGNEPNAKAPDMSKENRMQIVRAFNAELVYIRSPFPMGKDGLKIKNGQIIPDKEKLAQMMALWGPAAKPGDLARISNIVIKDNYIHFEINGGPVKKQKWYQRIQIEGAGGGTPIAPSDQNANARGSFVDLYFDHHVPELTGPELKQLLRPVFDFDSKSPVEAYLETVSPKVKDAIRNHRILVGMNHEMVMYSKGRAPKKVRERDGETDYEEWIYGEPPADVDFVRFVADEVIQVKTMKVDGQKIVRTEKEIELEPQPSVAKGSEPDTRQPSAPTLRRPGEEAPGIEPASGPTAPPRPTAPSGADPRTPVPNWVPGVQANANFAQ